jgi:hypothetical protein
MYLPEFKTIHYVILFTRKLTSTYGKFPTSTKHCAIAHVKNNLDLIMINHIVNQC